MGLSKTASRVISRYETDAILIEKGENIGSTFNPQYEPDIEHSIKAALSSFKQDEIDGTLIEQQDRKVFIANDSLTVEPDTTMSIKVYGVTYQIINVEQVETKGEIHFWRLQVRT